MNRRRLIGLDFDDVLVNFNHGLRLWHNETHETSYEFKDITTYDLEKVLGCSVPELRIRIANFYNSKHHFEIPPVERAVEAIQKLQVQNDFVIITSRPPLFRENTLNLMEQHFPSTFSELHFLGTFYEQTPNKKSKGEVCKSLGVEIFIEDALTNALSVSAVGIPVLLLDKPWNQQENLPSNITRVYGWEEILEILL